jgi:transporter family-2 protein
MLQCLGPALLAALAGASLVVQEALNANLRVSLGSAAWAGVVSYFVGLVSMLALVLVLRDPLPSAAVRLPWFGWAGGFFGATYIGLAILLVPRLGAATFVAALVTGQMLSAVACDRFGWLGLAQRALDAPRVAGVFLLIVGVVMVQR